MRSRARCAGSRPLRHYRDRRRAAPELQPHTSVLGAGGREAACRNRHSTFQLVREARHSLDRRNHATAIDPVTRRVALADGATVPYDKLLLATGSKPLAPPIPGLDFCQCARLPRYRRCRGNDRGREKSSPGSGLLGLEAAWGLKQRGMSVALVHLIPTLMERQLGECIEHNGQVFGLTRAGNGTIKIETKTARVIVLA
jgi:NADPH-dependent 2,4-dienoyl-CoA reductase/sulfur reductase-like enzyme